MKNTKIVSAFPGTGKTFFYQNTSLITLDSDSSEYSWVNDENGKNTKERNPEFPTNYIQHIKENIGKVDYIFVSSHAEVRSALEKEGLMFDLVYPKVESKEEYINRYKQRGSPEGFINLISTNWENWLEELKNQKGCNHVVLKNMYFISDVYGNT